jgi:hypothetical protein
VKGRKARASIRVANGPANEMARASTSGIGSTTARIGKTCIR